MNADPRGVPADVFLERLRANVATAGEPAPPEERAELMEQVRARLEGDVATLDVDEEVAEARASLRALQRLYVAAGRGEPGRLACWEVMQRALPDYWMLDLRVHEEYGSSGRVESVVLTLGRRIPTIEQTAQHVREGRH